jgi:hypothetical protein
LLGRKVELQARATREWLNLREFSAPILDLNLRLYDSRLVGLRLLRPTYSEDDEKAAKLAMLCAAIDAGLGVETTPEELMAEVFAELRFER